MNQNSLLKFKTPAPEEKGDRFYFCELRGDRVLVADANPRWASQGAIRPTFIYQLSDLVEVDPSEKNHIIALNLAETIKADIQAAIREGEIPANVMNFAELHDYVDANTLGDSEAVFGALTDKIGDAADEKSVQEACDVLIEAQDIVDVWLKEERMQAPSLPDHAAAL